MATQSLIKTCSVSPEYQIQFTPEIDFCVWILEQDGLHVAPFDKHSHGNQQLQAIGLTAENWLDWLRTIVLLQHPIWRNSLIHWERHAWVEQQLNSLRRFVESSPTERPEQSHQFDESGQQLQCEMEYDQVQSLYQFIQAQLPSLSAPIKDCQAQPALAFSERSALQQRLSDLWKVYQGQIQFRAVRANYPNPAQQWSIGSEWIRPLQQLNVHCVYYGIPVEMPVPPDSVILVDPSDLISRRMQIDRSETSLQAQLLKRVTQSLCAT